ncbi:MAG: ParA family protein [Thermoproteus sp.]
MPTVAVISASGGAGKTTAALALAYYAARNLAEPDKVLIVDLDPTAGLTLRTLGDGGYGDLCQQGRTLYHMDLDFDRVRRVEIEKYVARPGPAARAISNVSLLPPGEDDEGDLAARVERWFLFGGRDRLARLLKESRAFERYSHVVIDTAPFFDVRYTVAATAAADAAVVVVRPTVTEITRTIRMLRRLRSAGIEVKPLALFNYDAGRLVRETATLRELGFKISGRTGAGAHPDQKLRQLVERLAAEATPIRTVLQYKRELTDLEFPRSFSDKLDLLICPVAAEIYRHLGQKPPECPATYEEE